MNGTILLDTNIVVALFNRETGIQQHLDDADEVLVPAIVIGELYFGAFRSDRAEENVRRLDTFTSERLIVACDSGTAKHYGAIRNELRKRGRPIPENDIWIAALARQHDSVLVTRDAHFAEVEGLERLEW